MNGSVNAYVPKKRFYRPCSSHAKTPFKKASLFEEKNDISPEAKVDLEVEVTVLAVYSPED